MWSSIYMYRKKTISSMSERKAYTTPTSKKYKASHHFRLFVFFLIRTVVWCRHYNVGNVLVSHDLSSISISECTRFLVEILISITASLYRLHKWIMMNTAHMVYTRSPRKRLLNLHFGSFFNLRENCFSREMKSCRKKKRKKYRKVRRNWRHRSCI